MVQDGRYGGVLAVDLAAAGLSVAGLIAALRSGMAETTIAPLLGVLAGAEGIGTVGSAAEALGRVEVAHLTGDAAGEPGGVGAQCHHL